MVNSMKNINATVISKLIEAHKKGDEQMFESYANFIAEAYEEAGNNNAAKIIRMRLNGKEGNNVISLDEYSPEDEKCDNGQNNASQGYKKLILDSEESEQFAKFLKELAESEKQTIVEEKSTRLSSELINEILDYIRAGKSLSWFEREEVQAFADLVKAQQEELKRWHTSVVNENIKNPFANISTSICHNCNHKDEYIEDLEAEVEELRKKLKGVKDLLSYRDNAFDDQEFGASYCDLDNVIEEIRKVVNGEDDV